MGAAVQPAPGARLLGTFMYVLMSLWMKLGSWFGDLGTTLLWFSGFGFAVQRLAYFSRSSGVLLNWVGDASALFVFVG